MLADQIHAPRRTDDVQRPAAAKNLFELLFHRLIVGWH